MKELVVNKDRVEQLQRRDTMEVEEIKEDFFTPVKEALNTMDDERDFFRMQTEDKARLSTPLIQIDEKDEISDGNISMTSSEADIEKVCWICF